DPRPAHGEEVVVEQHVAHAEGGQPAAEGDDVVDAVDATAPAGGGTVAEGAGEGTAARRDDAGDGRVPVVEDVGLEAQRELGEKVPGRGREPVERVPVEIRRPHCRLDAGGSAAHETGDAIRIVAPLQPLDQLWIG